MAAEGKPETVDEYINSGPAEMQALARAVRGFIQEVVPDCTEKLNPWSVPEYNAHGPLCGFQIATRHITFLFVRGNFVHDPAALLEGTGKSCRHVKVKSQADLQRPEMRELLLNAVTYNRSLTAE
ncbi:MAG: DUF1801 domain-containing protein [Armatimonadetes bacterium]|nr:DUF1801 domain-containing protein [Armatimonadota bacterium]MDE2205162.1 DUF1801 domain-containing protein [Armatimonadota bacterium]